jgi:hypothetical protein
MQTGIIGNRCPDTWVTVIQGMDISRSYTHAMEKDLPGE